MGREIYFKKKQRLIIMETTLRALLVTIVVCAARAHAQTTDTGFPGICGDWGSLSRFVL